MRFEEIDDAACLRNFQDEFRKGTRLIMMPVRVINDFASGKINLDLIAFGDISGCFGAFKDRQTDVDRITKEDARK